jgi:hypothetical protein
MYFVHARERARAVVIALAIAGILVAAFLLLSGGSQRPFNFNMDELYGLLD